MCTPEGSVLAGQLQHVVATYDGARATFYLDGQPVADTTHFAGDAGIGTLQNWDETMHFMLGNEFTGERLWSGAIHLVAFYTQALTAEQVQANFQAGLWRRLLGSYPSEGTETGPCRSLRWGRPALRARPHLPHSPLLLLTDISLKEAKPVPPVPIPGCQ